jgi:hypothetical protein
VAKGDLVYRGEEKIKRGVEKGKPSFLIVAWQHDKS